MNKKENILVSNAINGDKKALDNLIKNEQKNIYNTLYYLCKSHEDVNDIMQNVLIKLTKNINKLKNPIAFKVWLKHIIINTFYDFLRNKKKNKEISNGLTYEKFEKNENPQDKLMYSELNKKINDLISSLPKYYKIPVILREIQGYSYEKISSIIKIPVGTVKSRISRGRKIIKKKIISYSE